jgi:hypothetical protein
LYFCWQEIFVLNCGWWLCITDEDSKYNIIMMRCIIYIYMIIYTRCDLHITFFQSLPHPFPQNPHPQGPPLFLNCKSGFTLLLTLFYFINFIYFIIKMLNIIISICTFIKNSILTSSISSASLFRIHDFGVILKWESVNLSWIFKECSVSSQAKQSFHCWNRILVPLQSKYLGLLSLPVLFSMWFLIFLKLCYKW